MSSLSAIKQSQSRWATSQGLETDKVGYCLRAEQNVPFLSPATRAEFDRADGREFGNRSGRAKIAAPHSSSALAVNVFDYWRDRDNRLLSGALGLSTPLRIRFEQRFPTGVGPRSPNIDVIITHGADECLAVESKFCEPFASRAKGTIQDKYFVGEPRWTKAGLPGAQQAAEGLRSRNEFRLLDAAQLLKHMLGLAQQKRPWKLLLLWYAPSSEAESTMNEEFRRFTSILEDDAPRLSIDSYQDLWRRLRPLLSREHAPYAEYLDSRYFAAHVV